MRLFDRIAITTAVVVCAVAAGCGGSSGDGGRLTRVVDAMPAHVERFARRADAVATPPFEVDAVSRLCGAHELATALMADDEGAPSLYASTLAYAQRRLIGDPGDGIGSELKSVAALVALVVESDESAGDDARDVRGAARRGFLVGFVRLRDTLGGERKVQIGRTMAQNTAPAPDLVSFDAGLRAAMLSILAAYEYRVGKTWSATDVASATAEALRARGVVPDAVDADFLAEGTGDQRSLKPVEAMTDAERAAHDSWLNSDQVLDRIAADRSELGQQLDTVTDVIARC